MTVRAKFKVRGKENSTWAEDGGTVWLDPVTSGCEENERFYEATPGGQINLGTVNKEAFDFFQEGDEVYVDFSLAKPAGVEGTVGA